jgi:hypothetical protein
MEIPPQNARAAAYYPDAKYRVDLNRALRDWKDLRRFSRTGGASYRDVRDARHRYARAQRTYTAVWGPASGGAAAEAVE